MCACSMCVRSMKKKNSILSPFLSFYVSLSLLVIGDHYQKVREK